MIKRQCLILVSLILSLLCFSPTYISILRVKPTAIEIDGSYTNVLDDLQSDSDFDIVKYTIDDKDFSLNVITIAESTEKELFVYVYQPCMDLEATTINISIVDHNQSKDFKNYDLSLINNQGVFYKYLVKNLIVGEPHRYEISSIFRMYDSKIDSEPDNGNTIAEISYPVGKIFTFVDGQLKVDDVEYIQITDKYVGFVRYYGGSSLFTIDSCDSHFVAFSTDKQIDKLLEADVYFQTRACTRSVIMTNDKTWFCGEMIDNYSYMTDSDEVFYSGTGLWKHSYSWSRIQTVSEFLNNQNFENVYRGALLNETIEYNLSENSRKEIENKQWVLRFFESPYEKIKSGISGDYSADFTRVFNVSILRLKFETDGIVYDLGVVDNKQTGKETPDNKVIIKLSLGDKMKSIIGLILLIIILIILAPFLPTILNFIVWVIKSVFGAIGKFFTTIGKLLKGGKHE